MGACGIILNLDGMLCYIDHYHYLAWKVLTDRLSLPFGGQVNSRLRGISRMEGLRVILSLGSKTYSQEEKEQVAAERSRLYRSYLGRIGPETLTPGAVDVLRALRENGWKTGIGSSNKSASLILERTGLDGLPDMVADDSQITKPRPDPEVLQLAARKLCLSPDERVVVEDASAGILAANAGDFFSIGLGDAVQVTGCHAVLNALYELPELCRHLYSRTPGFKLSDPTSFSQGRGAVKKEECPSDRRCGSIETYCNVRRVTPSAGRRVFAKTLPLRP